MTDFDVIFWFRRDLRLADNQGLHEASKKGKILPLFIFDQEILSELPEGDSRVEFIRSQLQQLDKEIQELGGQGISTFMGDPVQILKQLSLEHPTAQLVYNRDYEPYATRRDKQVSAHWQGRVQSCKDHLLLEAGEVLKQDGKPYLVFTPYYKKWQQVVGDQKVMPKPGKGTFSKQKLAAAFPPEMAAQHTVYPYQLPTTEYSEKRDVLNEHCTLLGPHLRFGTVSPRQLFHQSKLISETFIKELAWRDFFSQILFFFPHVQNGAFRKEYDSIIWRNDPTEWEAWKEGETGFDVVDAGMKELKATGYMHNRVRMIAASFLVKNLLIDWRWGEAYFAEKLLDFDLASNNGNWQWVAGTGCDAAPYFRVFNPLTQAKKFDPDNLYIEKWLGKIPRPHPIVDLKTTRERAILTYQEAKKWKQ